MKRVLCITLAILLLIPALLLPAAAAERKEYIFEYVEPVMVLGDDFDFDAPQGSGYRCDSLVPSGHYRFSFAYNDIIYLSDPFFVPSFEIDYTLEGYQDLRLDSVISFPSYPTLVVYFNLTCYVFDDSSLYDPHSEVSFRDKSLGAAVFLDDLSDVKLISYDSVLDSFPTIDFEASVSSVSGLFSQFTTDTLLKVLGVGIGASAGLALCWFGYRFIKKKLTNAFRRGSG